MPNTEKTTKNDSSKSENGNCNPRKAREGEDSYGGDMPKLCPPDIPTSSSPHILSMPELLETANEVSKMTIAHEIVVNRDFKLQEMNFSPTSLEGKVKETLHKAYWDNLREQLSKTPPDYSHAIKLLREIKETLLSLLLPRQARLRSQIEEALDMELMKQEAEHGALDIPSLTTYILGTMAMLCAPVRDEEVQRLRLMSDPVHLLREIFRVLDLMKMDMANFTIQTLRPHLQEHSVQYERKKFQELLNKLPGSLVYTTEWLRKAAAELSASDSIPSSSNGSPVSPPPVAAGEVPFIHSPTAVLNQACMDLLDWESGREYPETMLMDKDRLHALQLQVNQLAIIAAVLLVSSSTCGSGIYNSPGCVDRLKRVTKALVEGLPDTRLEDVLLDISSQICQEVNRILLQLGYPALCSDKAASLKGQLRSLADKDNVVRTVIEQRIQTFLRHCLSPGGLNSKNLPQGLAPVQEELLEAGQRFGNLIHHNRQVFGPYYSGILKKLLLPEGKTDAGTNSH
ncbi:T-complex protein 11 homolog isoform X2 [Hemicordylus capensis]|uniref:T-complex protein 11 homolog isoform X2 n=1 Tax=Hemicordylus capensis TaxID=884348 RepID=UPI0023032CE6|nr:T-complex protein 11 homolog isoform X2 [Hemicordylus capensis]XP_053102226.1 T-complex protein 11 homolog isoform X2 [Hemicordylus capensis]